MRVRLAAVVLSVALSFAATSAALATPAPGGPSKMLTDPALSAERIAFVYGNDVWTCRLDGSGVQRITSGPAAYSPDGKTIAYNPNGPAFLQWKRYRGGLVSNLWLFDVASNTIDRVPQPTTRCNDVDPMWLGASLAFRSDRDGEFNLYAYDAKAKAPARL